MESQKVFRVRLSEQFDYYVDVRAESPESAMDKVRERLDDPADDVQPIEDGRYTGGYVVEDAEEIDPSVANLD